MTQRVPVVHFRQDLSTREAYNWSQTSEQLEDGDIFVVNNGKTIGFLMEAWPTALYGEVGALELASPQGLIGFKERYPRVMELAAEMAVGGRLDPADISTADKNSAEW